MAWNVEYDKQHAFKIFSDSNSFSAVDNSVTITSPTDESVNVNEFTSIDHLNTKLIDDGTGDDIGLQMDDKIITFCIDQSGSTLWNDHNNLRYEVTERIANRFESTYSGNVYYDLFKFGGQKIKITSMATNASDNPFNDLLDKEDCDVDLDDYRDKVNRLAGVRLVRNENRVPQSPLDGEIVFEGVFTKITDSGLTLDQNYYYKIFTFDESLKFSSGKSFTAVANNDSVPQGFDGLSLEFLNGIGANVDSNTLGSWQFSSPDEDYVYDFTGRNDLTVQDGMQWISSAETMLGESGIRLTDSFFSFTDTNDDLLLSSGDGKITVMAWIYPYNTGVAMSIVSRYVSGGASFNYAVFLQNNGTLEFYTNLNNRGTSAGAVTFDAWNFIAITVDLGSGDVNFYINGALAATKTFGAGAATDDSSGQEFGIGYDDASISQFKGAISYVSVHSDIKDVTYIANRYQDAVAEDQDNGDRLLIGRGYFGTDNDYFGNEVRVVYDRSEDPSLPDEFDIVYQNTSVPAGDFYFTHKTDFGFDEDYYYRVFVKSGNNYSHLDDSRLFTVTPDYLSQPAQERKALKSVSVESPSSLLATEGNRKVHITWSTSNLGENVKQIRIYHSTEDYPVIDANSAIPINESYTGDLIFAGDPSLGKFLHQNILNDFYHYYTIVYSDGVSYLSTSENLTAKPSEDADETTIPLLDVESISYEQLPDESSINIFWELPYDQKVSSGYFDDDFVFFAKITDECGEVLDVDDFNVSAEINLSYNQVDGIGEDYVNNSTSLYTPEESRLYNFSYSKLENGLFKGTFSFLSESYLYNLKNIEVEVVINVSIPDPTSELDINGEFSQNIFTFSSEPFKIFARNPLQTRLVNADGQKVKLDKNNVISVLNNQTLQEKVEFDGFYVGASGEFKIREFIELRGSPVSSTTSLRTAIYETNTDVFSGDNLVRENNVFEEDLITNNPKFITREIDILDQDGNPTGEKEETTYVDFLLRTPSRPANLLVYIDVVAGGFRITKKFLVICKNPLEIELSARIPSADGVATEEQFASVYKVDPDDPDNVSARTIVPDGTPVIWTLTKGANATIDRPFFSNSSTSPTFETPDGSVVSFTTNGVAREVLFGPLTEVEVKGYDDELNPIFEQYEISANSFYDGDSTTASQTVELVPLIFENEGLAGSYFLMEFDENKQKFFADGISYAKLTITHDPNSSVTKNSSCFVECLTNLSKPIYTLSPGTGVQIATDDPDIEIIYSDVQEIVDPYTGRARLNTDDSIISYGSAIVPLENGDETHVYFRKNEQINDQEITSVDNIENTCECLGLLRESTYNKEIQVYGSLTSIFGSGEIATLAGGGSMNEGMPPTILIPVEPLDINLSGIRVEDTFIEGLQIDGDAVNELVFEVSFAGSPVPDGVSVNAQVINLTEDVVALYESLSEPLGNITTDQKVESEISSSVKSYASVKLRGIPRGKAFESYLILSISYDELDGIDRTETRCFSITYNSDEDTGAVVSNLFSNRLYSMNTAPLDSSWNRLADMLDPRSASGLLSNGTGSIFAIGGINADGILSKCEVYDVGTNSWAAISDMPTARFGFQSVYVSGIIYVFGGYVYNEENNRVEVSQAVEAYNTGTGTWSILTSMPSLDLGFVEDVDYGVADGVVHHIPGNIYILSGVRRISEDGAFVFYNDRILTYNIAGDSWGWTDTIEGFEVYSYDRIAPASFVNGANIYVLLGANQDNDGDVSNLSTAYKFDAGTSSISDANADFTDLPSLRYKAGDTFVASDRLYVLGGISNESKGLRSVTSLDISATPFTNPVDNIPDLPEALNDSSLEIYSSVLYSSGGNRSGNDKDLVLIDATVDNEYLFLNSRDTLDISVELKNDNGELVTDEVTVVARGYVQDSSTQDIEQFLVPDANVKYNVLIGQDRKTTSGGKLSFKLAPRGDDVLAELFEEISLNEGSFADRYKIIVEILIDSDTRFGKTILNTTNNPTSVDVLRSDCVSIFNNQDIAQLNISNTSSEDSFSLLPYFKKQGESAVVNAVTDDIWVNKVEKINTEFLDYSGVVDALDVLSREIRFGNSPLYNALDAIAKDLSDENNDGIEKVVYVMTDKEESFSSVTIEDAIAEVNSVDGPKEVPCVLSNVTDVYYPSIHALEDYTESVHLNRIASETNGQAITVRYENLDESIKKLVGKARGSIGYGNAKYIHDFGEEVVVKSIQVNYDLYDNTGGYWYVSRSDNGQKFIDQSTRLSPNELIDVVDFNTRYLEFDLHLFSGLSIANGSEYDSIPTTNSPVITSIDINYTPLKTDYIYLNRDSVPLDPSQVVLAIDGNNDIDDNIKIELGVSTADSIVWDDFDTDSEPAVDDGGKVVILRRQGTFSGNALEPLTSVDNYLYKTEYGSWHDGAGVTVYNLTTGNKINSSKYVLYPSKGLIVFKEKQTDPLYAEIDNSSGIKVAARINNLNSDKDCKIYGLGYLYTTNDNCVVVRPHDVVSFTTLQTKCLQFEGFEIGQNFTVYILATAFKVTRSANGFVWDDLGDDESEFTVVGQSTEFAVTNLSVTLPYTVTLDQKNPLRLTISTLGI